MMAQEERIEGDEAAAREGGAGDERRDEHGAHAEASGAEAAGGDPASPDTADTGGGGQEANRPGDWNPGEGGGGGGEVY
jgi:hypothetical protein